MNPRPVFFVGHNGDGFCSVPHKSFVNVALCNILFRVTVVVPNVVQIDRRFVIFLVAFFLLVPNIGDASVPPLAFAAPIDNDGVPNVQRGLLVQRNRFVHFRFVQIFFVAVFVDHVKQRFVLAVRWQPSCYAAVGKTDGFGLVEKGPGHSFLEERVAGRAPLVGIVVAFVLVADVVGGVVFETNQRGECLAAGGASEGDFFLVFADVVVGVVFETTQRGECLATGGTGMGHVVVFFCLFGSTGGFFLSGRRSFHKDFWKACER